ncbi:hypothetical protein [Christiangramia sp.]|uniref:hypothetical protein n=1 Tax=Christiangramia sp. TaxID=1931228 RepID=UPI00263A2E89|nr:hypothetical protein [Christiangramia sp.]
MSRVNVLELSSEQLGKINGGASSCPSYCATDSDCAPCTNYQFDATEWKCLDGTCFEA